MGYTITSDGAGGMNVSQGRGGLTINPPIANEVTGEIDSYEPEVSPLFDDRFDRFDAFDALPPQHQQAPEFAGNPFTDPSSTEADIRQWVLTPGTINRETINNILEGMEQNGASDDTRDLISELLAYKEGSIGIDSLSEEALEFLDDGTDPRFNTPADEILDSLSEDAQRLLEQVPEEEMNDLRSVGNELLGATADADLADTYSQAAEQCYQNADAEGAFVFALSARFHAGQISSKEAVNTAIEKLGLTRAYNCFLRLQQGDDESIQYGYNDEDTYDTNY